MNNKYSNYSKYKYITRLLWLAIADDIGFMFLLVVRMLI